jgi:Uma2 family endonuclease
MSSLRSPKNQPAVIYPDSDGQPMADNTLQWEWIATIKSGLDALYRDDPDVFVAGDLLWYPVEGDNKTRTAPDALVAFGRPKGYRGSYRQWEEGGVAPQVVFEVLSPGNRLAEMTRKFRFYEKFGVQEYYIYDPYEISLVGWMRSDGELEEIPETNGWTSPRLGVRFDLSGGQFRLFGPDGNPFLTYVELTRELKDVAQQRDELAHERDELAHERDEFAQQRDEERRRAERLAARLRELGEDVD